MKFQVKALAAALVLAAAVPAHAALDAGATGNGELFLNVYDTVSQKAFVFDLTPQAAYGSFGTFTLNDFLPSDLDNAQGLATGVTAGEAVPGVAGYNAVGAAEAQGINMNWDLSSNSAFLAFAAANSNSANWKWNVVALDNTGTSTAKNGRRYLTTVEAGTTNPLSQSSAGFANMSTVSSQDLLVNELSTDADPSVYLNNADYSFTGTFGDTWLTRLPVNSTNTVNTSASFYYLTGRSTIAINELYENSAQWKFNYNNGVAGLNYMTAAAVPEPETYAMLIAGLGLMGFSARRRSN